MRKLRAACVGAALVVSATLAPAGTATAQSQASWEQAFSAASAKYQIPKNLLMALSYAQSGWRSNPDQPLAGAAYGPMSLIDGRRAAEARGDDAAHAVRARGSLQEAAALTGRAEDELQRDPAANIDAGAALLAKAAQRLGEAAAVSAGDAASWHPALVAYAGGAPSSHSFADAVYRVLADGVSQHVATGEQLTLPATPVKPSGLTRSKRSVPQQAAQAPQSTAAVVPETECPSGLSCTFEPAFYGEYAGTYGNYYRANRGPGDVRYIVIHDIEGPAQAAINTFKKPGITSANYVISDTGEVTQMLRSQDMPWTNGNMWVNQHSISIEVAGYAIDPSGYTGASYDATGKLVAYLAKKYQIPLDRQSIIGHNNVPGGTPGANTTQHWDPGPYYDWNRLMMAAGAAAAGVPAPALPGSVVRVNIDYNAPGNRYVFDATGCGTNVSGVQPARASSAFWLRTEPRADAPLITDSALQSTSTGGTSRACNWGSQISTEQSFVVAENRTAPDGQWVALWYAGQKAWLRLDPAVTLSPVAGKVVTPKPGKESIQLWTAPYPKAADYPYTKAHTSTTDPSQEGYWDGFSTPQAFPYYSLPTGQSYVTRGDIQSSYYNAGSPAGGLMHDRIWIRGTERYYQIQYNHRIGYVKASDVDVQEIAVPVNPPTTEPTIFPTAEPTIAPAVNQNNASRDDFSQPAEAIGAVELATTGSDLMLPWLAGAATVLLGGSALLISLLLRRYGYSSADGRSSLTNSSNSA